ncbi:hypothetical protein Skr01_05270 [Sphaerisporangium krabiense]|uniref:Membrane protease YdiL (CAAX protease family) n=1 Tax=Sphaerisporangium krabiense TaxID=763782 RepID=A0A7W9DS16_9ACTN|nr:CPBP family intramembrane glutamic endopeptidase [Sphaerisporangium krabiense]MBB5628719.1 membrane protease YdiL (CAAX protease family) [Sphaerisporangium krabiense]GII60442.1 hypothetical protein Skr01_05270 [Sphaerisporangium krabiense]
MSDLPWPVRVLVLGVLVVLYYKYAKAALFAACRRAAHLLPFPRRWDAGERSGVLELAAAGASHVLVVALLAMVTGIDILALPTGIDRPELLALGAAIGVGEVALGSLLCRVLIEGAQAMGRRRAAAGRAAERASARTMPATAAATAEGAERMRQWLGLSRGGWIRHHLKTMEVVSLPLAVALTAVQVGSEEVVFRGLVLTWLRDAGPAVAIGVSCALFTVMQIFLMSSWRAAMFPVVGAVVMGLTHSLLFWHYPVLIPLMVAHVTFFLFAVA